MAVKRESRGASVGAELVTLGGCPKEVEVEGLGGTVRLGSFSSAMGPVGRFDRGFGLS